MDKQLLLAKLKGGLIVSCQALEDEPLHSSYIMSRLAAAAQEGGAVGIRANGYEDISAIKKSVNLPVIGIVKRDYDDSKVFITATLKEVEEVVKSGAEIIALDATDQLRPNGQRLDEFYVEVRQVFPDVVLMADISTFEEGVKASKLGFDLVATTLSGYTDYTKDHVLPNTDLIKSLAEAIDTPVMAEGGYWKPEELERAMAYGAHACIVGSAITRPREITKRFVASLNK
ncbi:N-acetylmannosamine-6-phosphate 2-epimerase [Planococcus faecalis]|uniref:Putative N-acetylmannosamine-6-phosphate 2-epimerase n=1 Tax=Planococcus faecalis TaxID=1598147 RepID=A0ABN4XV08_9BACL|nr:N-acetylmannosamine-6-phosphate 2-epimerase [Planococcus faecalis]AQU80714.1 N-acetylmannosamine-6-phosphate 2-epimerase [Planococcus faecalis]OHX55707.1 N-acetylmannosamine-6-phosphate 2-epimerase [Planococcus faecalis]